MGKVFIAGVTGLLGKAVERYCQAHGFEVLGVSRGARTPSTHLAVDILKPEEYVAVLKDFKPEIIINCVALVDLAKCEKEPEYARAQNCATAKLLAQLSLDMGARFIHFSTDHLFDGKNAPYAEVDSVSPMNQYGETKLLGERAVLETNSGALVIRTNIVGVRNDPQRPTFAEWLNASLKHGSPINLFFDFITSSAHVDDVVYFSFQALGKGAHGILNIAARDAASKFDFGMLFAKKAGYNTSNILMSSMRDAKMFPPRPFNIALNCAKAEELLGVRLPSVEDTVEKLKNDFSPG